MIIEIPKGTSETKVKAILKKIGKKKRVNKTLDAFFGSLPDIEDGLKFQKRIRRGK